MSSEFHVADSLEAESGRWGRASAVAVERVRTTVSKGSHQLLEVTRIKDRMATPAGHAEDLAEPRGLVLRPALLGFVALLAISIGASMPSSPFKLEMPGVWFFGEPTSGGASTWGVYFGLAAVYGGLLLLMRVWWGMTRLYARRPGIPIRQMKWVFVLWSLPMMV
ncbi:MAG TPA: hypothetical protein VHY77_04770, partial [Acidimicrobiales bacterium]|nr:hypothetical protein [Acidimicrobiales bacterium]